MNKLDGIKPGDRVRVTFEGVADSDSELCIQVCGRFVFFSSAAQADPTFQIERIEPPLAVNDRVRWPVSTRSGSVMEIISIYGDQAWVALDGKPYAMPNLSELVRADA